MQNKKVKSLSDTEDGRQGQWFVHQQNYRNDNTELVG
jgi:hypothetical protein